MLLSRTLFLLTLGALPLRAVVVAQGDGTQNTTAPVDDFGWNNVGTVYDLSEGIQISGVYLGNGWVVSAYHGVRNASMTGFQFGGAVFGGIAYDIDAASAIRLMNPNSSFADLALFRLTAEPNLPSVEIAASAPASNLAVSLGGNGPNRAATGTNWLVNTTTNPFTWTETPLAGNAQGYHWGAGQALRWGTNQITAFSGGNTVTSADDGFGITDVFKTTFNNNAGEGQGGFGDSGGGVFWKVGGQWQLGGIMLFVTSFSGQPGGTAVYGNETYAANLASYRSQIAAVVPEPSAGLLAMLAGTSFLVRRRRYLSSLA